MDLEFWKDQITFSFIKYITIIAYYKVTQSTYL